MQRWIRDYRPNQGESVKKKYNQMAVETLSFLEGGKVSFKIEINLICAALRQVVDGSDVAVKIKQSVFYLLDIIWKMREYSLPHWPPFSFYEMWSSTRPTLAS